MTPPVASSLLWISAGHWDFHSVRVANDKDVQAQTLLRAYALAVK
jgi:hypothetical protein